MYSATANTNSSIIHFLNFKHMLACFPLTEMEPKQCSALGKCLRAFLHKVTSLELRAKSSGKNYPCLSPPHQQHKIYCLQIFWSIIPHDKEIWCKCLVFHKPPLYFKRVNVQEVRVTLIWSLMWMCVSKQKLFQLSAVLGQMYLLSCKRSTMSPNIKKWWEFKFQHTRNNLPPEQQATATSTWQ